MTSRSRVLAALLFAGLLALPGFGRRAEASPQFARQHGLDCTSCHLLPPALNEHGLAFQASGYRSGDPGGSGAAAAAPDRSTLPMAAWITGRYEDRGSGAASDLFLPKVELISGGVLGRTWSYFVEWRIVSLSLNSDGSLGDRGGRFEDLFFEAGLEGGHSFKIGQFRALNQVDVSLRLSASEPLLFGNGLQTGTHPDPRLTSLDRFSPSGRSPGVGYSYRSLRGDRPSDGLFHHLTVPFVGELSIPLGEEASRSASFELTGPPKGVYGETFYRRGLKSIGGHAFYSDEGWLATAVGTWDWNGLLLTGGLGTDDREQLGSRLRGSLQAEYFFTGRPGLRAAPGLRIEDVTEDGRSAAWVPYLALALPNTRHTFLLQVQFKSEDGNETLVVDLSALF